MRTLIIGFVCFLAWTSLSSYLYMCKVKNNCLENVLEANTILPIEKKIAPESIEPIKETEEEITLETNTLAPMRLEPMNVYYNLAGSSLELDYNEMEYFDHLVKYMKENPGQKVSLVGYTCDLGDTDNNIALAKKRAEFLRDLLINKGIDSTSLIVISGGESNPLSPNTDEASRTLNRRVEIRLQQP
ncbi:OmpA family protein [Flammeovirgaceae bacterium SG7u.111]|nr:OmpA family protein [Flammeovirgaceae bacterium SG7u.132]WPO33274.1 OmpA family protein [Flammeovirgaceae bacterium SG7u.111]